MRAGRKLIVILILFIIIFLFLYLIKPSHIITVGKEYNLVKKILIESDPDLFGENNLTITEKELNRLIAKDVSVKLQNKLPKGIILNGLYIELAENNIVVKTSMKTLSIHFGINLELQPIKVNGKLAFKVNEIHLGRLNLPLIVLKMSKTFQNNTYFINDNIKAINLINISELYCFENKLNINYTFNRDAIINTYIDPEHREAIQSFMKVLNKNQDSRFFFNDLLKAFITISMKEDLSKNFTRKIKKDFNSLDFNTKKDLFFLLLKYNLQVIKNLL
ncbi:hypothetical protein Ana3638_17055 [Anaerocolumna sedimenticola]|uniref:Uncharacterized protein n=1 Tax=Anaerocolumna sedimenticola TaxID=2696063 RepID=A0A6P1TQW1_9FIRM|nr:hypothetical protein [Anaerocolumna sedimenticola]QHQ62281.1 hypothetical protein Ana3638_17055 [Anaerocolumna sedimenticola]